MKPFPIVILFYAFPKEKSQLSDANRRKEREIIQKDVQKLVGSIQSITRSVNPLGKYVENLFLRRIVSVVQVFSFCYQLW